MSLLRSVSTVGGFTLASRVLGFLRDVLMAQFLGAGLASDCFFVAFKLPNFFRRLFAEGAFAAAFVPLFSKALGRRPGDDSRRQARAFAEDALAVLVVVLLLFTAAMQAAMPLAMTVLAPGFIDEPEKYDLAVDLTRATFPYLLLISLVSLLSGMLNALGRFAAAAAAPILLNLVLITSLLIFNETQLIAARALAYAVSLAGIVQFVWLLLNVAYEGFAPRLPRPRLTPGVKCLLTIMAPVAVGAGVTQINLVLDIILASLLAEGSLSFLFYADRLNQLPLGVIGIAVGTVLLPQLSRTLAGGDVRAASAQQCRALEFSLYLTLPAACALAAVPDHLIRALFEHGEFTAADRAATADALRAYALGLPAFVLIKVLTPAFYAREDTRTPVKFAVAALVTNAVLNVALMIPFAHVGLALATAIAAWLNAALLFAALIRRGHLSVDLRLKARSPRMLASAAVMGLAVYALGQGMAPLMPAGIAGEIALVAVLVSAGVALYAGLSELSGALRLSELKALFRRA